MSTASINLNSYLQSIDSTALQGTGWTTKTSGTNTSAIGSQTDSGQLSGFAQLVSTLQQLQQANPAEYKQVTQQIATNLNSAAQTAQSEGNTAAATQLNQLSTDFTTASQSGQMPNFQDLAQAMGGHHHHHHHVASSSDSSGSNQSTDQLLAVFQTNATENDALNPTAIIMNTLSNAGVGVPAK
jgi:hypothetical protein